MPDLELDVRKRSVTRDEAGVISANYFFLPIAAGVKLPLAPSAPAWWSQARDFVLRRTIHAEGMWASALSVAVTKVQAAGFEVDSEVGLRAKQAHELLTQVDFSRGYKRFMAKLALDFLTCDNGAFVEIVRASDAPGAKIVGLAHLDSLRCTRTGDDDVPVIYTDNLGHMHEMRDYQVFDLVDMPDPSETWNGVGHCAAGRAYDTIYKLSAIETYVSEASSGRTPTKLVFIGGIPSTAVENAMQQAQAQADAKGLTVYMGAAVQAALSDKALSTVEIALKEIPAGFDVEKERNDAYLKYANAIGLDPQELQPLTGRPLGTATQSQVLDDKQSGKGLVAFFGMFSEMMNLRVLPDTTTHHFTEKDFRDQQAKAAVQLTRAQTRSAMILSGEITPQQALQMAVDEGDAPKEFLTKDMTPDDKLADDEKPTEDAERPDAEQPEPEAQATPEDEEGEEAKQQPTPEALRRVARTKERIRLKEHSGAMVALFLPLEIAETLSTAAAVPIREVANVEVTPVEEMHLTLCYLGKAADIENYRIPLQKALSDFARNEPPMTGKLNGVGRFEGVEGGEADAVYASYDAPALPDFRQRLMGAIQSTGIPLQSAHGFTPHITLAYLPVGTPMPDVKVPGESFTIDTLTLAWGGERADFRIGDTAQVKESSDLDMAALFEAEFANAKKVLEAVKAESGTERRVGRVV